MSPVVVRTPAPPATNVITLDRTRFIGRETELEAVHGVLEEGRRLVSIVGAAGVGKTRLARRVAVDRADVYPGGVWFCELTAARTADQVLAAVAHTFGVSLSPAETEAATHQLGHALDARGPLLLVLDNFEQLTEAASATLGAWLDLAPQAQLLVTSIVRLGLEGETCFELPPLSPEDAAALYEDRARLGRGDLQAPDPDEVRELVAGLDHLPLAIELAAARASLLSPRQLLARIDQRLELLQGVRFGRHTSLVGAIACTVDLLSEPERDALAQCSVFRGGFTLAAAEAVVELSAHPEAPPILDVVEGLRQKSLLRRSPDDPERFALFESVREYAARSLAEADALRAAEARHGAYGLELAESLAARLAGPGAPEALRALAADRENLLAAQRRALDGAAAQAARIGLALAPFLFRHGPPGLEREVVEATVTAAEADGDPVLRASALRARGLVHVKQGRPAAARADLDAGLALAADGGLGSVEGRLLTTSGHLRLHQGELEEARSELRRAIALHHAAGERAFEAEALNSLGGIEESAGRLDEAARLFEAALEGFRALGDARSEGMALTNLGIVRSSQGRGEEALRLGEESLRCLEQAGDRNTAAGALVNLGDALLVKGALDAAEARLERALALARGQGNVRFEALALGNLGIVAQARGNLPLADRRLQQSLSLFDASREGRFRWVARSFYAAVEAVLGRVEAARADFAAAREAFHALGDPGNLASLSVLEGFLDLAEARQAAERLDLAVADRHVAAARARLEAEVAEGVRSTDVTVAARILAAALEQRAEGGGPAAAEAQAAEPPADALVVAGNAEWFRPPGGEPVDLSRRGPMRLVLQGLVEQRLLAPGVGLDAPRVFTLGWPGEQADPAAAANRVYAAIRTLRKLGLGELLERRGDGYLLDPTVEVVRRR